MAIMFENGVIPDGTQTGVSQHSYIKQFENGVIPDGTQTPQK